MKVTNLDEVIASLDKATETIERKLKAVVKGYIVETATLAIQNTPYGSLVNPKTGALSEWYPYRSQFAPFATRVDEVPGTARNNWKLAVIKGGFSGILSNETLRTNTPSGAPFDLPSGSPAGEVSMGKIKRDTEAYELGDFVVLWNDTPYINRKSSDWSLGFFGKTNAQGLEQGSSPQAPDGIRKPTVQEIISLYKAGATIKANFDGG